MGRVKEVGNVFLKVSSSLSLNCNCLMILLIGLHVGPARVCGKCVEWSLFFCVTVGVCEVFGCPFQRCSLFIC